VVAVQGQARGSQGARSDMAVVVVELVDPERAVVEDMVGEDVRLPDHLVPQRLPEGGGEVVVEPVVGAGHAEEDPGTRQVAVLLPGRGLDQLLQPLLELVQISPRRSSCRPGPGWGGRGRTPRAFSWRRTRSAGRWRTWKKWSNRSVEQALGERIPGIDPGDGRVVHVEPRPVGQPVGHGILIDPRRVQGHGRCLSDRHGKEHGKEQKDT
jgi:hypothetical protein